MNYGHIALAFLGGIFAYFVSGFALFAALPGMKAEFLKFPNVYRSEESMKKVMPFNLIAILLSVAIVAVVYAKIYAAGGGIVPGVEIGALMGVFAVCTFVIHNYVFLNISAKLTIYEGITYLIQWVVVGAAVGLIYKP